MVDNPQTNDSEIPQKKKRGRKPKPKPELEEPKIPKIQKKCENCLKRSKNN